MEAQAQIQSHASPCGFSGESSRTGFVPSTSVFFLLSPFHPWFILVHSLITDIQSQQQMTLITFTVLSSQFLKTRNQITAQFEHPFSTFLFYNYIHTQQSTNFPRGYKTAQNSRCQRGDMKHVPYWECINIKCHHTELPRRPGSQDMWTSVYTNNTQLQHTQFYKLTISSNKCNVKAFHYITLKHKIAYYQYLLKTTKNNQQAYW